MTVTSSVGQILLLSVVVAALGAAGCASENPQPSAPRSLDGERLAAKAAKVSVAEEAPAATPAPPAQPPGSPASQELRYGPKSFTLPAGCGPTGVKFSCNPLTNAGCRADDDEVCDDDDHGGFGCDADSDNVKESGECNDKDGPSCAAGMTCDTPNDSEPRGVCRKFCCAKADCPPPMKCVALDRQFGTLGVCK
ncbi:MAG: hypothetical protein M3O50_08055 [Myxococcota bacterium]|nr:hypothetical protein [Myxococcota bacterium]